MGKRLLLVAGWLWPFAVACGVVAAITAGHTLRSDGAFLLLFVLALLGTPAVVATIAGQLPARWPAEWRFGLAVALAMLVVVSELFLAVGLLAGGASVAGPGWIE